MLLIFTQICITCSALTFTSEYLSNSGVLLLLLNIIYSLLECLHTIYRRNYTKLLWKEGSMYFISYSFPCISQILGCDSVFQSILLATRPIFAALLNVNKISSRRKKVAVSISVIGNLIALERGFHFEEINMVSSLLSFIGIISSILLGKEQYERHKNSSQEGDNDNTIHLTSLIYIPIVYIFLIDFNIVITSNTVFMMIVSLVVQSFCTSYARQVAIKHGPVFLTLTLSARRNLVVIIMIIYYNSITVSKVIACASNLIALFRKPFVRIAR